MMPGSRYIRHRAVTIGASYVIVILLGACSGSDTDEPATPAPDAAAAASSPTVQAAAEALKCGPGSSAAEQKLVLVAIASDYFGGVTAEEIPRLFYTPDARDRRQGGIWVTLEFVVDDSESIAEKKADMDQQMMDAYERLYTAGCGDLAQVDLSGRAMTVGSQIGRGGGTLKSPVVVFKTKLEKREADAIDWGNKASLDFNEIWDNVLLNPRWRDELEGTGGED